MKHRLVSNLRNHLEHFDERIDRWVLESERHNSVDMNIGPYGRGPAGLPPGAELRWYDPETRTFYFRGEAFALEPIVAEVARLQ